MRTNLSDGELVERLERGDSEALREVMARHGASVYRSARAVVVDEALAEEVAQDTFIALWRRPASFDPARGPLRAFLLGVARKKGVDAVRKEGARRRAAERLARQVPAVEHGPDPEQAYRLHDALGRLTDLQRQAIVLAYFGGLTYREVAGSLGVPEGTAKTRLRDGLTKLRAALDRPVVTH